MTRNLFFCCFLLSVALLRAQTRDLDFYQKAALENSPIFRDLKNQAAFNRQDSLLIRAALKPQISATAAANLAPTFRGFGYDAALSNGGFLSGLIGFSQPIVQKPTLDAQFRAISIQNATLKNTARLTEQDIRQAVGQQFITAFGVEKQLVFNRETLDFLRREATFFKQLAEQNIYRQTDYLTFLNSVRQQETAVAALEIQFKTEVAALGLLCGLNDTAAVSLAAPSLVLPALPAAERTVFFEKYTLDSLQIRADDLLIDEKTHRYTPSPRGD